MNVLVFDKEMRFKELFENVVMVKYDERYVEIIEDVTEPQHEYKHLECSTIRMDDIGNFQVCESAPEESEGCPDEQAGS